jgi:hypothetical protein
MSTIADDLPIVAFSIDMESAPDAVWSDTPSLQRSDVCMARLGYEDVGDFLIPQLPTVVLRGYCHRADRAFGALYEHPDAGLHLDLLRIHVDRLQITVTTLPPTGMDSPGSVEKHHTSVHLSNTLPVGDLQGMHDMLMRKSASHEVVDVAPRLFPLVFKAAYEREMNWRIERGGITAEEALRAAEAAGLPAPDDKAIERLLSHWRACIARHQETLRAAQA